MVINVQRSGSTNLARSNPFNTLYIKGSEGVDSSIRLIFTEGDNFAHIELRTGGVWNDTSFRFDSSSVLLGRDLSLSAVGGFLETVNFSMMAQHLKTLVPHIEFTITGTMGAAHMPVLDTRETFIVFAGPKTGEIVGTTIGQAFTISPTRVLHSAEHLVGSVGATEEIRISYYKGSDNTGIEINRMAIDPSDFVADQPLIITYDSDFGFENIQTVFFEFTSDSDISLSTNAGGDVITSQVGHTLAELDIILDELVLANDLSLTFDNDLNFVVNNRFP